MNRTISQFDTVRIPAGISEYDIPEGAIATVLDVYEHPYRAYEIEVVDDNGRTVFVGVVDAAWVELVESYKHGDCP